MSTTIGKDHMSMNVGKTPLAQSQDLIPKESNVLSLLANTSNTTPTIPAILTPTQSQVSMIVELNDAVPTFLVLPKPSKVAVLHSKLLLTYQMMTHTALELT
jgi:hypothetical protein